MMDIRELEGIAYAVTAVVVIVSLVFSISAGGKWEEKNPSKLGFKWGLFFISSTLLGNVLALIVFLILAMDDSRVLISLITFGVIALVVTSGVHALRRRKWALVVMTLLSLNAFVIIINFFYLRNRWAEFGEEHANQLSSAEV